MEVFNVKPKNIQEYIDQFTPDIASKLQEIRNTIKEAAPTAVECISYSMPAFKQNKILVYFAGYGKHIGFYPTPSALTRFESELTQYKRSKGAVQFSLDEPLPIDLIREMVKFRVEEDKANEK